MLSQRGHFHLGMPPLTTNPYFSRPRALLHDSSACFSPLSLEERLKDKKSYTKSLPAFSAEAARPQDTLPRTRNPFPLPLRDSVMCCGQFPSLRVMNSSTAQLQKEKGQGLPTSQAAFWPSPRCLKGFRLVRMRCSQISNGWKGNTSCSCHVQITTNWLE